MITPAHAHLMATYNQWMNQKLYGLCAALTDEQRKSDQKAFFKSIHGTLNHILLGDKVWLGRFTGHPFLVKSLDQILYDNFDELRHERELTDARIMHWTMELNDLQLANDLVFHSITKSGRRRCSLWIAVTHYFNHQTHHRGQLTTLLHQLGIDPGVTDMIAMHGVVMSD
jgi:uncharacterized damage-inducible protein DinB